MASTRDIDVAKDRLVDSLSSARDVVGTAVRDDIAPAVVAAVEAAREASGPVYAEAASRAGDAVSALRGSDAAKALRSSDAVKKIKAKTRSRSKRRWPIVAGVLGVGAAVAAFAKHRGDSGVHAYPAPTAAASYNDQSDATVADSKPDSA